LRALRDEVASRVGRAGGAQRAQVVEPARRQAIGRAAARARVEQACAKCVGEVPGMPCACPCHGEGTG